ncbi:neuropeptide SIFamide receptor-like [Hermetia illucens]|uniref:neuropeptide SIFamide receptor-like n=1 Tax=Hermetia illucens TaxID=343691 RepID=UPI0018CC2267|nr:neuropeptide SIFamide receptor-like [Hermetia illucens]
MGVSNESEVNHFMVHERVSTNESLSDFYFNFTDDENFTDPGYILRYGIVTTVLLSLAYGTVFIIGVLGNISVVIVITRTSKMRSLTNQFIANLAVADLLVNILCLPFTLVANLYPAWILGVFFCKTVSYLQGVSVSASVNTLMAISIERCAAISFPLSGTMSNKQYRISVTIIWFVALTINLPWLFVFTLEPIGITGSKAMVCIELWPSQQSENIFFIIANLIICYLGPLVVISICYIIIWRNVANRSIPGERLFGRRKNDAIHKSRVKVVKMVFVVIITFALSWLPLYTIFFIVKFYEDVLYYEYFQSAIYLLLPIAQWLGAANSCINPILYAFMNRKFRIGFKNVLKRPFFSRTSFENEIRDVNLKQYRTESLYNRRPIVRTDSSRMSSHYNNNVSLTMRPVTERIKL